jgi:citrate synthase
MAEEQPQKTPLQKLKDVVSQLKEMEHYARNNMESLSEIWLLLDDEFKKRKTLADRANDLLKAQGAMQEQLASVIEDFDKECAELEKKP